jgi:hypothetical protein
MSTKLKSIQIVVLAMIIWVSGCSGSLPLQTSAPTLSNASATIRVTPRPMNHTLQENKLLDRPLSPDGEWSVEKTWLIPGLTGESLVVDSTHNQTEKLSVVLPASLGNDFTFASWSPDSHAFAYFSSEKIHGCEKCPLDSVVIFTLDKEHHSVTYAAFDPEYDYSLPDNWSATSWAPLAWSPDSSQVAVSLNLREILLLDKQASLMQRVTPNINATSRIIGLSWTENGLFYNIDDYGIK